MKWIRLPISLSSCNYSYTHIHVLIDLRCTQGITPSQGRRLLSDITKLSHTDLRSSLSQEEEPVEQSGEECEQGDTKDPCFVRMPSKRAKISRMSFHHILDFLLNPCSLASRGSRRKPERAVSFKLNWFRYVDLSSNPRLHSRNLPNSKLNLNLAGCAEMWAAGCELVFGLSRQSEKIILE